MAKKAGRKSTKSRGRRKMPSGIPLSAFPSLKWLEGSLPLKRRDRREPDGADCRRRRLSGRAGDLPRGGEALAQGQDHAAQPGAGHRAELVGLAGRRPYQGSYCRFSDGFSAAGATG